MDCSLPTRCPQHPQPLDATAKLTAASRSEEPSAHSPVAELLLALRGGQRDALERLFPLVYGELERLARWHLARERVRPTLESAELVHEAYIRLVGRARVEWKDQHHFYALASRAMHRVLVDYSRRRRAAKRGGGWCRVELKEDVAAVEERADILLALDEALMRLAQVNARLCRVVECRFFGGLSALELAGVLGVTDRTVRRDWSRAKAWLHRELTG